jgi:hypothetical protein
LVRINLNSFISGAFIPALVNSAGKNQQGKGNL